MSRRQEIAIASAVSLPEERGRWPALAGDWLGSGRRAQTARSEFVSQLIRTADHKPLSGVFPGLSSNTRIPYKKTSVRVRNCFYRHQALVTWSDFCEYSVLSLLQVPNAGVLSVSEFLELALVEAITLHIAGVDAMSDARGVETPQSELEEAILGMQTLLKRSHESKGAPSDLDARALTITQWASSRRGASTFGDLFTLRPEITGIPDDLRPALADLHELPLEVDSVFSEVDPLSILSVLSESVREIFCRRNLNRDTLRAIAKDFGVTREAIRRTVQRAETKLAETLDSDDQRPLRWLVSDIRRSVGRAYPIDKLAEVEELETWLSDSQSTELLLWMSGPYTQSDGWLLAKGTVLSDLKSCVTELCDVDAAPTIVNVVFELSKSGIVERAALDLVNDSDRFRIVDGQVFAWGRTIIDKAATVLSLLGRPATDQEILDHIGGDRSLRSLRNRLMEEPAFMRTDRNHFALREWNVEEYSGISAEIAERIQRAGGAANLEEVVDELLATFTISESSIRQYAAAHRFVTSDGLIWLRTDEEIDIRARNPLEVAGTYKPEPHRLRYAVEVTADTLRGSGRGLPRPLAVALGATPGLEKRYVSSDGDLVRVAWRLDSASGPDMGSLSSFCAANFATVGDLLVLDFDTIAITVEVSVVNAAMSISEQVTRLTGIDHPNPQEGLAQALGVHAEAVRAVLRRRGDDALVDSLPESEVDPALQEALGTLSNALMGSA